jgi:tripartite-type tricarboxylate transporter receptor subunit TctC
VIARFLAERVRLPYASSVIVENKPGASTRLAVGYVKNAEPDGSVLLFTPQGAIVLFPHTFRNLTYEPLRDLTPVSPTIKTMLALSIGPGVPQGVRSLSDFMEWCNTNPDDTTFAAVTGGPGYLLGFMLARAAGVPMVHVPYKGGPTQLQDVLGGHVAACFTFITDVLPLASSRALRVLAVSGSQRSPFLPGIPTLRELGYDVAWDPWTGVFAPARLPPETLRTLSAAIREVVISPEMSAHLATLGADPMFQSPEEFAATIRADIERWGPVVKQSGIVAN